MPTLKQRLQYIDDLIHAMQMEILRQVSSDTDELVIPDRLLALAREHVAQTKAFFMDRGYE